MSFIGFGRYSFCLRAGFFGKFLTPVGKKIVTPFPAGPASEFNGVYGTDGNTALTLGAVPVPDRPTVMHRNVHQRAELCTCRTADAAVFDMKAFVMYKEAVKASDYKIRNCSSGITVRYAAVKENLVRDTLQLRHGCPDNTDSFVGFRRTEQGDIVFRH